MCMHLDLFKGSQGLEESYDSSDSSDSKLLRPVPMEVEEKAMASVILSLTSSDLRRSATQTQGFITIHCIFGTEQSLSWQ